MGSDASPGEHPTPHTSTDEWQSFEQRMRQRRIDRLLVRARLAREEGHEDEARAALEEASELRGEPIAPPEFEQPPEIVICDLADDDLTAFDHEVVADTQVVDVVDLPLYPELAIASEQPRSSWGPRVAAMLTACVVLFWFTGPRVSQPLATAVDGVQPQPAARSPRTNPPPRSLQSEVQSVPQPAPTELAPVRLAVTDVAASAAPVDSSPVPAGPPVSLAGLGVAEPRATSPEPSARPESIAPPPPVPPDPAPTPALPATVPVSSPPTLEVETPPFVAPTPPPVASAPEPAPPPASPPANSAVPEVAATAQPSAAAAGVRTALMRYESAYSRLDADAASAIWPALDRKALARAFDGLASQEVSLGSCEVRIVGESAVAECAGSATWTPKVGGRSHRQARRWQFQLKSVDAGWQIVSATVR